MARRIRHTNEGTTTQMACEAAESKDRVRRRLQAMLDEAVQDAPTGDLFEETTWLDSSRSGEFEAVGA